MKSKGKVQNVSRSSGGLHALDGLILQMHFLVLSLLEEHFDVKALFAISICLPNYLGKAVFASFRWNQEWRMTEGCVAGRYMGHCASNKE